MKTEKILAGEPYNCADKELITRWHRAKQLQKMYADTPSDDAPRLAAILDELLGFHGDSRSLFRGLRGKHPHRQQRED